MFKLLGPFLALAAMTASVINAQCAVSCLLRSNPRPIDSAHSCCPHKSAPLPVQPRDGGACHHTVAAVDEVLLKNGDVSFSPILLPSVAGWSDEYGLQFVRTDFHKVAALDSPGQSPPSLASILRV